MVRGGQFEAIGGQRRSRNVVIEFKDYETALACYNSPEYQANIKRCGSRIRTPIWSSSKAMTARSRELAVPSRPVSVAGAAMVPAIALL